MVREVGRATSIARLLNESIPITQLSSPQAQTQVPDSQGCRPRG